MRKRRRAEASQYAERVNRAVALLRHGPVETVLPVLVRRYQISRRQARRYVGAAQQHPQGLPVPEPTVAFTVKLPVRMVRQVRAQATATGLRLSTLVTRALEDWLERVRPGPAGGR